MTRRIVNEQAPIEGRGKIVNLLGRGVYSIAEAARLTQLRPGRVRDWFRSASGTRPESAPIFRSDYAPVGEDRAISFLDLIEVSIAGKLRAADPPVSLQHIRKVHRKLSDAGRERHPFCLREIYHDAGRIFTQRKADGESGAVIEPLTDQVYINAVIMPFLKKIEYDDQTSLAKLWHIAEGVVVDPARCFGKPVVAAVGIATRVLASSFEANGRDARRVADWYEVDPAHVETAVQFESKLAA